MLKERKSYLSWVISYALLTLMCEGFPDSSVGKGSACNAVDPGSIPGLGRSPGEGIGYLLQYSWASLVVQLVICLQCWRPGFNLWVGKIPWRKEWLPTPVFWPGEFHKLYSSWGRKESDTTERLALLSNTNNISAATELGKRQRNVILCMVPRNHPLFSLSW